MIIKELKSKKSCGYDEITARILNISSPFIVSPLTYICNRLLTTGTFPGRMKFLEIKPMYKMVTKHLLLITGPSHYCLSFQKLFKSLYIKDPVII